MELFGSVVPQQCFAFAVDDDATCRKSFCKCKLKLLPVYEHSDKITLFQKDNNVPTDRDNKNIVITEFVRLKVTTGLSVSKS